MKKIKSVTAPFDVILQGVPVVTVTDQFQIFDEEISNLIIKLYSTLIEVVDVSPEEAFADAGVQGVDNTEQNGN